jgi:hypothetical protein
MVTVVGIGPLLLAAPCRWRVDTAFRAGDTDSAIRDAFADLEDAVRNLAGYTRAEVAAGRTDRPLRLVVVDDGANVDGPASSCMQTPMHA